MRDLTPAILWCSVGVGHWGVQDREVREGEGALEGVNPEMTIEIMCVDEALGGYRMKRGKRSTLKTQSYDRKSLVRTTKKLLNQKWGHWMGRAQTFRPEGQEPLLCREAREWDPWKANTRLWWLKWHQGLQCATANLSLSVDLPTLDMSCKRNHTDCDPVCPAVYILYIALLGALCIRYYDSHFVNGENKAWRIFLLKVQNLHWLLVKMA